MGKFIFSTLAGTLFIGSAMAGDYVVVDNPNFDGVVIKNGMDVRIQCAPTFSIVNFDVDSDVDIATNGDVLEIKRSKGKPSWLRFLDKNPRVLVNVVQGHQIQSIHTSGSSSVQFDICAVNDDYVQLTSLGSSNIKGYIHVNKAVIDIRGSSDVNLFGNTKILHVLAQGSSTFNNDLSLGRGLSVENAMVNIEGSSDVKLCYSKNIKGQVSGSSTLRYGYIYGKTNRVLDIRSTGSSDVEAIHCG